jgi:hypothetical protein
VATLQGQIRLAREQGQTEAAKRAERVLAPLLDPDAPSVDHPLAFARYRWRIAREIMALHGDHDLALGFAAIADNPQPPDRTRSEPHSEPFLRGTQEFAPPQEGDWVLHLTKACGSGDALTPLAPVQRPDMPWRSRVSSRRTR